MKISLLTFIFFLLFPYLYAQTETVFIGAVTVKGGKYYPYKLQFKDSAGLIKGYSVTDIKGPDETKTAISGIINTSKKEISFKETRIINTKSEADKESFCFITARLKLTETKGTKGLKGRFTGYKPDGKTVCATGDIMLFSAVDVLDRLMAIAAKTDAASKPVKEEKAASDKPAAVIQVVPGKTINAAVEGTNVTLELWDDKKIDGDIVSVLHNGRLILDHYLLQSDIKQLNITLSGNKPETISLVAISEGAEPPNTAMLRISSGKEVHLINASSEVNKPANIVLKPQVK